MTELFKYLNYKDFLKDILHSPEGRGLQGQLARHLGCQSAYIYQVLKGKGELTEDQAYKVTTFFKFETLDRDYFLLLVRFAKAASPELRSYLKSELAMKSAEQLNLKNRADATDADGRMRAWDYYFSGELPSLIHILTSSKKYQTPSQLARKLGIPEPEVQEHLEKLAEFEFVIQNEGVWHHASPSIHFAKSTSHNLQLQLLRRSQGLKALIAGRRADHIHFSSLFTLDRATYDQLRTQIAKVIQDFQKQIHQGGSDEAYVLSLDLFAPYAGTGL